MSPWSQSDGWVGLWWERFLEKVSFEFRVEKSRLINDNRGDDGRIQVRYHKGPL